MNSAHEGYGVIKEELEELSEAYAPLVGNLGIQLDEMHHTVNEQLWAGVKADDMQKVTEEATHVAAMEFRFLLDIPVMKGTRWKKRRVEPVNQEGTDEQERRLGDMERQVEKSLQDQELIDHMRQDLIRYERRHADDQALIGKLQEELTGNQKRLQDLDGRQPRLLQVLSRIHDIACRELQTPLADKPREKVRVDPHQATEVRIVMGGQRFKTLEEAFAAMLRQQGVL